MSSTYSPSLRAELIGAGDQSGTWGSTTNNNFQYIFEAAIAGFQTVAIAPTSNNQVLTYTNGPTSTATADQSVYAILKLNASAVSANFNLFAPPTSKTYIVWNNTSYTATFYNSTVIGNTTAAGSGIVIPAGAKVFIWSDGTNFYGNDTVAGNLSVAGNLTVTGTATFTGIPSGPTAAAGTNTTQLATTAFVLTNNFPAGTKMPFAQSAAPTFWTQVTDDTATNRMLRVVNTAGGSTGGSNSPILMDVVPTHNHSASSNVVDLNHTHGISDPGHSHSNYLTVGSTGAGGDAVMVATGAAFENPTTRLGTNGAATGITGTGYMSANYQHSHSITVNSNSGSNWAPRYIDMIICSKN